MTRPWRHRADPFLCRGCGKDTTHYSRGVCVKCYSTWRRLELLTNDGDELPIDALLHRLRTRYHPLRKIACKLCETEFSTRIVNRQYCSQKCAVVGSGKALAASKTATFDKRTRLHRKEFFDRLPPRSLQIVQARIKGQTLHEIGAFHRLTRERVRQILYQALKIHGAVVQDFKGGKV